MKIFYLQIRKDPETRAEEFAEFVRFSGLPETSFTVVNVFDEPYFDYKKVDEHDGLIIGGSSDDPEDTAYIDPKQNPYITNMHLLIQRAFDTHKPSLLICFGCQVAAQVLGGEVILDKKHAEIGMYDIEQTPTAQHTQLFADIPSPYVAVCGHKKRITTLPPNALNLGSTPLCPIQGFTFPDRPFYALQFHPELDKADLTDRFLRYFDRGYLQDPTAMDELIASFRETPDANRLVRNFVTHIIGENVV